MGGPPPPLPSPIIMEIAFGDFRAPTPPITPPHSHLRTIPGPRLPGQPQVRHRGGGWAIPVYRTLLADHLTPVTAYERSLGSTRITPSSSNPSWVENASPATPFWPPTHRAIIQSLRPQVHDPIPTLSRLNPQDSNLLLRRPAQGLGTSAQTDSRSAPSRAGRFALLCRRGRGLCGLRHCALPRTREASQYAQG